MNASQPAIQPSAPTPASEFADPSPGPTLPARVGDIVQLVFLNQVDARNFGASFDRGDTGDCDLFTPGPANIQGFVPGKGYPANAGDTFPNCLHGSSTANIHFHGTHTNPNSTGDNIFLFVRPALTASDITAPFEWKQRAQDGAQLADVNYRDSLNVPVFSHLETGRIS